MTQMNTSFVFFGFIDVFMMVIVGRPFKCAKCDYASAYKSNLTKHLTKHKK